MEMHEVRYFLAVARTLNFTRAAEECHVAQPSLSRAIKKLEAELGGDLFRRERALTHPTDLGRLMLPALTQIYNSAITAKAFSEWLWLVVSASHPFAMRNRIEFRDLSGQRIFPRYYCEVFDRLPEILRSHDISLAEGDQIASDHDLLSLLAANAGVAVLPETMVTGDQLRKVMVNGLTLDRSVYVYAVSGRERSPAASAMIKLLRSSDWSRVSMPCASAGEQQQVLHA